MELLSWRLEMEKVNKMGKGLKHCPGLWCDIGMLFFHMLESMKNYPVVYCISLQDSRG